MTGGLRDYHAEARRERHAAQVALCIPIARAHLRERFGRGERVTAYSLKSYLDTSEAVATAVLAALETAGLCRRAEGTHPTYAPLAPEPNDT